MRGMVEEGVDVVAGLEGEEGGLEEVGEKVTVCMIRLALWEISLGRKLCNALFLLLCQN
jgi:hypothetical protein